ncbi:MAG: DUF167 domain-containing protein [Chloroflexi bacterium]|nr:MAG: DUF167 domain-containing protein [Chloroflexota bacterium]
MRITVRIKPGSRVEGIEQDGDILTVRVRERPVQGKANRAAIRLLARHFAVPESEVCILRGHKSKTKVVEIGQRQEKGSRRPGAPLNLQGQS